MPADALQVGLVTAVFHGDGAEERLRDTLAGARARGVELVVLPELPLNAWSPSTKVANDEDAEEMDGPRHRLMSAAAAWAEVALVGGAIVRDPATGRRHNTALVFGPDGSCLARYRKVHLPEEDGYWETSHYEPGDAPPPVVDVLGMRTGLQICSDVNRTTGFQLLQAMGADIVCAPRATPPETYDRWRLVLRANAVTGGAYVLSTNRPGPVPGTSMGGATLAIAPDGTVLAETTDPLAVVTLERSVLEAARNEYPGYLELYPELYAQAWRRIADARLREQRLS